jgi:hypothetical protein
MARNRSAWAVVVLLSVGVALLWLGPWNGEPSTASPRGGRQSSGTVELESRPLDRSLASDAATPSNSMLRVRVVASAGVPIRGAAVIHCVADQRTLDLTGAIHTDENGIAELMLPPTHAGATMVAAAAPGWRSAAAERPADGRPVTLTLASGHSQSFAVSDSFGMPVKSALVTLSRTCLGDVEIGPGSNEVPAPGPDAIHRAFTDALGRVTLAGLPEGDYLSAVHANGYVTSSKPEPPIRVPGEVARVVLEPLAGLVVAAREGAILGLDFDPQQAPMSIPSPPGQGDWMRARRTMGLRWPGAIVAVGTVETLVRESLRGGGRPVDVTAFVDGHGFGLGQAQFQLLPGNSTPQVLTLRWLGQTQAVRVSLLVPDGTHIDEGQIRLTFPTPIGERRLRLTVELGKLTTLPLGAFEVEAIALPVPLARPPEPLAVLAGQDSLSIPMEGYCRWITVDLSLPDDTKPLCVLVGVEGRGRNHTIGVYGGAHSFWVGEGPLAFHVHAPGAGLLPLDLEFEEARSLASPVLCRLQWQQ